MSDLVIKDFDRKAGTAFIWTAGAMLAFALAVPFHYAIHFAVAPAADILTGFATDNGVRDLAAIQRAAAFAFALPGILLFSVALLAGATVIGALGFELKGGRGEGRDGKGKGSSQHWYVSWGILYPFYASWCPLRKHGMRVGDHMEQHHSIHAGSLEIHSGAPPEMCCRTVRASCK